MMIFTNPFFLILIFFMFTSLMIASQQDGKPMPERQFNFTQTMFSVLINFLLIFGAVVWAVYH